MNDELKNQAPHDGCGCAEGGEGCCGGGCEGCDCEGDGANSCKQCQEYLLGWKRAQADYANLKKELETSRSGMYGAALADTAQRILPTLDQLDSAVEHMPDLSAVPDAERSKILNWADGVKAIKQSFEQTLKDLGCEPVDASGTFDPMKHEAVGSEVDADKPHDAVVRVLKRGWSMGGKVIRPASVTVNSKP